MAKVDQQIKDLRNTQELLQAETVSLRQRIARLWEAILSVITHPPDDVIIADGRTVEPATDGQANLGTAAKPFGVVYANSFTNPGGEVVATEITDQDGGANIKAARSAAADKLLALDGSAKFPTSVIPAHGVESGDGYHSAAGLTTGHVMRASGATTFAFDAPVEEGAGEPGSPFAGMIWIDTS